MHTNTQFQPLAERMNAQIAARCEKDGIAGMSLVLADASGPVMACTHGYADLYARTPFTEDTLLGIASVSKLFTATGIMRLVEAGKIDLEKPVSAYIPEFLVQNRDGNAPPIRMIDLMTHHSGLPRDWLNHFYACSPEPFDRVLAQLKDEYACRPAGYYYSYSNLGIALLGAVLARVAGVPYEQYVVEEILRPIGMVNSSFEREYRNDTLYAQSYDGLRRAVELPPRDKPAGGLYASARELGHFIGMYLSGGTYSGSRILEKQTIDRMLTPQLTDAPMSFGKRMGLNWHLNRPALEYTGRVAHHGGALVYYRSELCILPDRGLGVAVMSNSSTATQAILELAEECLQQAVLIKDGIEPKPATSIAFVKRAGVQDATPEGHYATSHGHVQIRPAKEGYAFHWNNRKLVLKSEADNTYRLYKRDGESLTRDERFATAPLRFCHDVHTRGKVLLIGTWPDGEAFSPEPVPREWLERQGLYRAYNRLPEEALTDIMYALALKVKRGILYMEIIGPGYRYDRVLRPEDSRKALRLGWAQGENETLHVRGDKENETLHFMGLAFRKASV